VYPDACPERRRTLRIKCHVPASQGARGLDPESELSDTPAFEPALTDFFLFPGERFGVLVVCGDECIDVLLQLLDGRDRSRDTWESYYGS
jgi:hypothetical protein